MSKSVVSVLVVSILLASNLVGQGGHDSKEVTIDIRKVSVEPASQDPDDENTIFFKHSETDATKYFSVTVEIRAKPVNVVLLLDQSSSMNNDDIEDVYGSKSISRIDIEKRISRQILESLTYSSEVAIVCFGGNDIQEYPFDSDREKLEDVVDSIAPEGMESCGGEGLDKAIDLAVGSNRQCVIVIISDGLEIGEKFRFIDIVGRAVTNEIVIYSAMVGREDDEREMKEIAGTTGGKFYIIDEMIDMLDKKSLVSDIVNLVNDYSLEDLSLELEAPPGVHFEEVTSSTGKPEIADDGMSLSWDRVGYEEPVVGNIRMGVRRNEIDRDKTTFTVNFRISFKTPLKSLPDELHPLHIADIPYRFETESKPEEKNLCSSPLIGCMILLAIIVAIKKNKYFRKRQKDYGIEYEKKNIDEMLKKKLISKKEHKIYKKELEKKRTDD